ncbi:MAG: hypothetical protein AVDCRST_MAG61-2270, partial [uncultured Friedmanniella sp.]
VPTTDRPRAPVGRLDGRLRLASGSGEPDNLLAQAVLTADV